MMTNYQSPSRKETILPALSAVRSLVVATSALLLFSAEASAQLAVEDTLTPEDLVDILLGPDSGITASNVSLTGNSLCAGAFTGGAELLGIDEGIVLSSGQVVDAEGPNEADDTTTNFGEPGDSFLDGLVVEGFSTFDACVLEFDFECTEGSIGDAASFQYVFTSEEYNEFTNSAFTNVFGFELNGVNVALLPDGTAVQINTVNGGNSPLECSNGLDDDADGLIDAMDPDCFTPLDNIVGENNANSDLFRNNDSSDPDGGVPCPIDVEADGLTVVLGAEGVIDGEGLNTIRIAIGDVADAILDSWVFLEAGSFSCQPLEIVGSLDVKPGSCPNPVKGGGVVPMALLGTEEFNVLDVDPGTCVIESEDGEVTCEPRRSGIEDVATPFLGPYSDPLDRNDCTTDRADGFDDLTLKFDKECIQGVLASQEGVPLTEPPFGEVDTLTLSCETDDGTPVTATDVVWVK